MKNAPEGTQSIVRAVRILKQFDDDNPDWDLQELTEQVNLNKTTVFRILGALESEGLLQRLDNGRYTLGSEAISIGGRAARVNNLRSVSHNLLLQLTQVSEETTTLEVLSPDDEYRWSMLVIDEALGKFRIGIIPYIGSRLPVHATSTGKAVLAFMPKSRREEILKYRLRHITDATQTTASVLREELAEIREQGFAVANGELEAGLVAIGAPLFDVHGEVNAAISLVGPSVRLHGDKIVKLAADVQDVAQQISHKLGYRK